MLPRANGVVPKGPSGSRKLVWSFTMSGQAAGPTEIGGATRVGVELHRQPVPDTAHARPSRLRRWRIRGIVVDHKRHAVRTAVAGTERSVKGDREVLPQIDAGRDITVPAWSPAVVSV